MACQHGSAPNWVQWGAQPLQRPQQHWNRVTTLRAVPFTATACWSHLASTTRRPLGKLGLRSRASCSRKTTTT